MKKSPIFILFVCFFTIGAAAIMSAWLQPGTSLLRGFKRDNKIGVVEIEGLITQSREIIQRINTFADNRNIRALVVRIDSPGGAVGPSQEIYEELIKARDKKPIIASMGSVAASGGYYIASAAHKIFANPGTITGSLGVIIEAANIEDLLDKIGYRSVIIKSGKYKDTLSPMRPLADDERALIQAVIDNIHGQFIDAVALGRSLPREKIAEIADGRIFSGEQARALGLVDELGNLEDALKKAAEQAGIEGTPDIMYPEKKRFTIWEYLIEETATEIMDIIARERMKPQFLLHAPR